MVYISGVHALNLPCSLNTTGDWHLSAIQWDKPLTLNSEDSLLGEYGIEEMNGLYVANHIRAILDLMLLGDLTTIQGFREDFICNEEYTQEILQTVIKFKNLENFQDISNLMIREYRNLWRDMLDA